ELLGSTHMADLVEALEAHSDIVILDSPPVLAVTDALVLTAHADGVLMVMAKGRTSRLASCTAASPPCSAWPSTAAPAAMSSRIPTVTGPGKAPLGRGAASGDRWRP